MHLPAFPAGSLTRHQRVALVAVMGVHLLLVTAALLPALLALPLPPNGVPKVCTPIRQLGTGSGQLLRERGSK
jgi:hypothetical protein